MDKDPTVEVAKQYNAIVEEYLVCGHIDKNTRRWAYTDTRDVRTHMYYHLPKVHKQLIKPSGRPIISGTNVPMEKLSQLIDSWLQEYVSGLPSFVKDSTHMLNNIQEWNIQYGPFEDIALVTFDITTLYTNIPHADMTEALTYFLEQRNLGSTPPADVLIKATQHVLDNNYFKFEGQCYKQVYSTTMGIPMLPAVANLFMGWLERKILENSPMTLMQNQWKRFIDDIFVLWLGLQEDLQTFSQYLNTVHPIKFTTASLQTEIPFLDIMMKVRNSLLQTDLHIKPTDAHNYFHHLSAHPHHCKNSIPFSQFL